MPPLLLFAHGAGAPSTHPWMKHWAALLKPVGEVACFDYPYMAAGRRTPDRQPQLIAAHRAALASARETYGVREASQTVLIGKSMGGRMGCHVALEEPVGCLVCLGYPLVGQSRPGSKPPVRDAVLKQLRTPVLFVQGTRDALCPLELLASVREQMHAPSELWVVESGDHSLQCTKRELKARGKSQDDVDQEILGAITRFVQAHVGAA